MAERREETEEEDEEQKGGRRRGGGGGGGGLFGCNYVTQKSSFIFYCSLYIRLKFCFSVSFI
jgi:hypothetical protein